jgi:hypothetical protein
MSSFQGHPHLMERTTWRVDQVGVKAPGNPTRMTFFPATRSLTLTFSGGNPKCKLTPSGMESPTLIAVAAEHSRRIVFTVSNSLIFTGRLQLERKLDNCNNSNCNYRWDCPWLLSVPWRCVCPLRSDPIFYEFDSERRTSQIRTMCM